MGTTDNQRQTLSAIDQITGEHFYVQGDSATGAIKTTSGASGGAAKPSDAYGIQAISETATYKYFYFEDDVENWYILRKTLATSVFAYAKGTGGYTSVYTNSTSDPSGGVFDTYGATF